MIRFGRTMKQHFNKAGSMMAVLALSGPLARGAEAACLARVQLHMGTLLSVETCGGSRAAVRSAVEGAFRSVEAWDLVLSRYREDSELSRLLGSGPGWHAASSDLLLALEQGLAWSESTKGTFDLGYLSPGQARGVKVDFQHRRVFLPKGIRLDFGGLGKGLALDSAASALAEGGVSSARLNFGGQVLVVGKPPPGGWEILVADPQGPFPAAELRLRSGSASTSGNSERPGHIVDPRNGRSVEGRYSVTVVASDGASADALSTALFVMGPEEGLSWAGARKVAALFVVPGEGPELRFSPAMIPHLKTGSLSAAPG